MKTEKIRLFSYIASAALVLCLLMYISLAWYLTTKQADASGIGSQIAGDTIVIEREEYFQVTSSADKVDADGIKYKEFEVSDEPLVMTNGDGSAKSFKMPAYDALSGNPTEILLKITLNEGAFITSFSAVTAATQYIDQLTDAPDEYNSLSSIISFCYLEEVSFEAKNDAYDEKYFVDINGANDSISEKVSLLDGSKQLTCFYVLIGYYEESIENIYSNNLANPILSQDDDIEYICDFKFNIVGGIR